MKLSYGDIRRIDDKLDAIRDAVDSLVEVEQQNVQLRARVAELEAQIADSVTKTDAVELAAQAGLPTQ